MTSPESAREHSSADKIHTNSIQNSELSKFLNIVKALMIGPILSEKSPEDKIRDFTDNLGDLLIFLLSIFLNIKENIIKFLSEC